jgi:hypothetical protein
MKLLIIAGPYEADRIRRAVVSAGFEAVAVEPGESLSGWITASRPDLIVMAPQIVNADPAVALGKVRAVPRGRVPTFLVGEAEDEPRMKDLADGFLTRPLSTDDLVARVRERLGKGPTTGERRTSTGEHGIPTTLTDGGSGEFGRPGGQSKAGQPGSGPKGQGTPVSGGARALPTLKPLVAAGEAPAPPSTPRSRTAEAGLLLGKLAEGIDAALDADLFDVARSVEALRAPPPPPPPAARGPGTGAGPAPRTGANRRPHEDLFERTPMAPMTALAAAATLEPRAETTALTAPSVFDALDDAEQGYDETRQKTLEVPRDVFAKMIADRIAAARDSGTAAGAPAPVESGKIAAGDVAAQLGRLYLRRLTGRLVLRRDAVEKVIYFDRGAPILGTSSDPQDRMGEMLVRQGRLTPAQLERASEGLPRAERRLGAVLVEMGFIKPTELAVIVRRHFEEIIHSAFAWEDGEWSLGPGKPDQEIVLLDEHPAAIVLAGIRRKYGVARLSRCLGGHKQVFRRANAQAEGAADLLPRMAMTEEERTVVDLFDGTRSLDDVRGKAHVREEVVLGIAWALSVLGQLDRVEPRASAAYEEAVARVKTNGAAKRPPELDRRLEAEAVRTRVLARHALVEEGDYFEVLSLPRGASVDDVKKAHETLMRELEPTSLDPAVATELGAQLRAIRVVLDEALRVLGEPRMRERYERHLPQAAEHAAS